MSDARLATLLSAARDLIEEVLLGLPGLPARVDRAPIASMLASSLDALTQAAAGSPADPTHLDGVGAAGAALAGAAALLATVGAAGLGGKLRSARRALEQYRKDALDRLATAAPTPERAPPPLRASFGAPALHALDRRPLPPRPRMAPLADDAAEAPAPRPARDDDPAAALHFEQLRRVARDCFAELGQLGNLREVTGDELWSPELARFEDRLLADLDAAVALGRPVFFDGAPSLRFDVLRDLLAFADDAFCPDPGRAFARAFVLGCVEGDDAARAAVVALRQSPPSTHDAQRSAFTLASSPALAAALEPLVTGADPALAALALDVLRARREGGPALAAVASAHPAPAVRRAAAGWLGASRDRATAIALAEAALGAETDVDVAAALVEALLLQGARSGLDTARELLSTAQLTLASRDQLLRGLALGGGPTDVELLHDHFVAAPGEVTAEALGWHGHPGSVEVLLRALVASPPGHGVLALRQAIGRALQRITDVSVEPTEEGARAFAAWWAEARARFGSDGERSLATGRPSRYRHGRPYSPDLSLDELSLAPAPARVRDALAAEIAIATHGAVRLDPSGWIARQLAALPAARDALRGHPFRRGTWAETRHE